MAQKRVRVTWKKDLEVILTLRLSLVHVLIINCVLGPLDVMDGSKR